MRLQRQLSDLQEAHDAAAVAVEVAVVPLQALLIGLAERLESEQQAAAESP